MEDHTPHGGAHHGDDKERQEQQDADRPQEAKWLGEEQRQSQTDEELDQYRTGGEQRGDDDGPRELGVDGQPQVVGQPDEANIPRPDQPPAVEADPG